MTSIEAFHLHSSSEQWPNCVTSRYHFTGSIDIDTARQAWAHCLGRQKPAAWEVKQSGRPKWNVDTREGRLKELADSSFHDVLIDQWPEHESELKLPNVNQRGLPQVNSATQAGFGLWCIRAKENDRAILIFAADHALADGAAAIGFVREWMLAYHNLVTGNDIERGLTKLDWERWKRRSHLGLMSWSLSLIHI